jgi:hypothetical protein
MLAQTKTSGKPKKGKLRTKLSTEMLSVSNGWCCRHLAEERLAFYPESWVP